MAEYKKEYRIYKTGKINSAPSNWNTNMFNMVGGTFKGDPTVNYTDLKDGASNTQLGWD